MSGAFPTLVDESELVHVERYFGHFLVKWRIDNFLLKTCRVNDYIYSEVFYIDGSETTRWTLVLNPRTIDECISLSVRRINFEPNSETVSVEMRVSLICYKTQFKICENSLHEKFDGLTSSEVSLIEIKYVYEILRPFDSDELLLECEFLVIHGDRLSEIQMRPCNELKSLSDDLLKLYTEKMHFDVLLETDKRHVRAHKAILRCRNRKFKELFDKYPEQDLFNFTMYKDELISKILNYIYSGDMGYLLMEPSIELYKYIATFCITEALPYYVCDHLNINTIIDVKTSSCLWTVPKFSSSNTFTSPVLEENADTTWQIHISSRMHTDCTPYVNFAAEITKGMKQQAVCVEFGVTLSNQNILCLNRILKYIKEDELTECYFSVERPRRDIDVFIEDDTLNVVVKIRMATGTYTCCPVNSYYTGNISITKVNYPYYLLSGNMLHLLTSKINSDVQIKIKEGIYEGHKSILYARCPFFAKKINEMKPDNNEIALNLPYRVLMVLLMYIYSGQLVMKDHTLYPMLNISAKMLCMPNCESAISRCAQKMISVPNVCEILTYADKCKDTKLKYSAIKFIHLNKKAVYKLQCWKDMKISSKALVSEVENFKPDKTT